MIVNILVIIAIDLIIILEKSWRYATQQFLAFPKEIDRCYQFLSSFLFMIHIFIDKIVQDFDNINAEAFLWSWEPIKEHKFEARLIFKNNVWCLAFYGLVSLTTKYSSNIFDLLLGNQADILSYNRQYIDCESLYLKCCFHHKAYRPQRVQRVAALALLTFKWQIQSINYRFLLFFLTQDVHP